MFEIKVTITNTQERERAEYVKSHIDEFLNEVNDVELVICEGDVLSIDIPPAPKEYASSFMNI